MCLNTWKAVMLMIIVIASLLGFGIGRAISNSSNEFSSLSISQGILNNSPSEFSSFDLVEEAYESTLRSCLGSKCFNQPVIQSGKEVIRIGFLYFPGSGGELLYDFIFPFINDGKVRIEFIQSTQVPAYGYGKNHGWSSIIRLTRRPIHHSYHIVTKLNPQTIAESLSLQIKQIVTWHCRLNHVAAHTRLLTVFTDQLVSRPRVELEKILSFVSVDYDRKMLISLCSEFQSQLKNYLKIGSKDAVVPLNVYKIGLKSLKEELDTTNVLTDWPCKSFVKNYRPNFMSISPEKLAANCTASYVTCSVRFDQRGG